MKTIRQIEATRKTYHKDPTLNTIHRASLLVPEIPNAIAEISFINHFLLKRQYSNVACKITAIDTSGKKLQSKLHRIDKPVVYNFKLTGMVTEPVSNYMIEFFAPDNLFIPFPAVMINHHGKNFINQVHAFNRVLNDVFEDDDINSHQVKEASIDLVVNEDTDTFLLFTTGPLPCKDSLEIEVITPDQSMVKKFDIDLPRFGVKRVEFKKLFDQIQNGTRGIIKAAQPSQFLFYGRMLSGQVKNDGTFSANHTFYDSTTSHEYWDDFSHSQRFYPYFPNLKNTVRLYPILSPSELQIKLNIFDHNGNEIKEYDIDSLSSPSTKFLDANIESLIAQDSIDRTAISTFSVTAMVLSGKMPTRIGHQLVYGNGGLDTSIAVSLFNPNIYNPPNKKSFKWGQIITGNEYNAYVGLVADKAENPDVENHEAKIKFYDDTGFISEESFLIKNRSAKVLEFPKFITSISDHTMNEPKSIWCIVESEKQGLNFFSVTHSKESNHCSGDHGF